MRRVGVSPARVKSAVLTTLKAEGVREAMISIAFVGATAIARMNQKYLRHRGATDVISFGLAGGARRGAVIGDVYICPEIARTNARSQGVTASEELLRLVVHGTLHALGYDHPLGTDRVKSPMWRRQEQILARVV